MTPPLVVGLEWAPAAHTVYTHQASTAAQSWSPSHCCTEVRLASAVGTGSIGNVCIRPHHSGITQCYSTAYGRTRQRTLRRAHSAGLPGGAVRLGSQLAGLSVVSVVHLCTITTNTPGHSNQTPRLQVAAPKLGPNSPAHRDGQPEPECSTKLGQGHTAKLTTHRQQRPRSPPPRFAGWLQGNTHAARSDDTQAQPPVSSTQAWSLVTCHL